MKLASRYNRVNVVISLAILLITAICYYLVIHYILTNDLDKDLAVEEQEIFEYVRLYHKLPPPGNFKDQIVRYSFLPHGSAITRQFNYTDYKNADGTEPGRNLVTGIVYQGVPYRIEIIKSRVEAEDLIRIIFLITLLVTGILLLSISLINRFVLRNLWKPFHTTLSQMKAFKVSGDEELQVEITRIDEFSDLHTAVMHMSANARKDYTELKNFTDNASHEMMTPLAVIHSKLDSLLQNGPFNQVQAELLDDIYKGTARLARLNQSLLLMAKIDHQLISDEEEIGLDELVEAKLRQFSELIQSRQLQIVTICNAKKIIMSRYLADMLLNNLLVNAIRHNLAGGSIHIHVDNGQLSLKNTGENQPLDDPKIFERFYKNTGSEGMGLGLAISRQICTSYGFSLLYRFEDPFHCFIISF